MGASSIEKNLKEAQAILQAFIDNSATIPAMEEAGKLMVAALKKERKIISCGNGGSMCDAMHFAEELSGLFI
jgi:D-sedoheptulose 7-phosphate isomerase